MRRPLVVYDFATAPSFFSFICGKFRFPFFQWAFQVNGPQSKQGHFYPWSGKLGLNKKQYYLCRCCSHLRRVMKRRLKERTEEESLVIFVIIFLNMDYQGASLVVWLRVEHHLSPQPLLQLAHVQMFDWRHLVIFPSTFFSSMGNKPPPPPSLAHPMSSRLW